MFRVGMRAYATLFIPLNIQMNTSGTVGWGWKKIVSSNSQQCNLPRSQPSQSSFASEMVLATQSHTRQDSCRPIYPHPGDHIVPVYLETPQGFGWPTGQKYMSAWVKCPAQASENRCMDSKLLSPIDPDASPLTKSTLRHDGDSWTSQ